MVAKNTVVQLEQANKYIKIRGARTHNLQNIDLDIPKNSLTVITGMSGSGKSSLAFDTLYAEGQGRYIESLSTYARQFLQRMDKPDVDLIEGLAPAIAIEQKTGNHNPRSTIGTVTEIQDYLRLLFARIGTPFCPTHNLALHMYSVAEIVEATLQQPSDSKILILAPLKITNQQYKASLDQLNAQGFVRFQINQQLVDNYQDFVFEPNIQYQISVVIDRLKVRLEQHQRLADSIETALKIGNNRVTVLNLDTQTSNNFTSIFACNMCDYTITKLEPKLFSFNSPSGACQECNGLGESNFFDPQKIIAFPSLSLANGAIAGWDSRNSFYFSLIKSIADEYKFDLNTAFEDLSQDIQQVVLYGSNNKQIQLAYSEQQSEQSAFEGIINNFARRYKTTDSPILKEKLGKFLTKQTCPSCNGSRLNTSANNVKLVSENTVAYSINQIGQFTLSVALDYFNNLQLHSTKKTISQRILDGINKRLFFLNNVGLGYLSLSRAANTLSGGEAQRIRLASQIGAGLTGVLYVLDEPSIGLHQKDNQKLIQTLKHLRDLGNTVIVVEHDEDTIRAADYVIDMGPGAGINGGQIVCAGTVNQIMNNPDSLTGQFLAGKQSITAPSSRKKPNKDSKSWIKLIGASANNLKDINLEIPVGLFTCITGVSGSGKSTLINRTLYPIAAQKLNRSKLPVAKFSEINGLENFDKVINVDQTAIGRTPRSNPATYTGVYSHIRELFANTLLAQERGYSPSRFSFNISGGRCELCQGDGIVKIEMHFLSDVYVECQSCKAQRFNKETLEVTYKHKNIAQVLDLNIGDAYKFFAAIPNITNKLKALVDVGLSYIKLGQSATTLSGGEAQRMKLALELAKKSTGKTLYILDEPTTGLHFADIKMLLEVLFKLRDAGNSIVVIEHNLDVIKTADWIIDLGPEGGINGGNIIAQGTVEQLIKPKKTHSYTTKFLKNRLNLNS